MSMFKIPFNEFYVIIIKECYQNYQINREIGARRLVLGSIYYLVATYPEHAGFLKKLIDSLDITENINSGRFIYVDEYLALTYNQDIKNNNLGELLFASRNKSGFYSYNKTDIFVPINSLRHAKKALINYQGKPRKGELIGNDSVRFGKFLGLEIRDGYAYMSSYQELEVSRGKGFNK